MRAFWKPRVAVCTRSLPLRTPPSKVGSLWTRRRWMSTRRWMRSSELSSRSPAGLRPEQIEQSIRIERNAAFEVSDRLPHAVKRFAILFGAFDHLSLVERRVREACLVEP